VLTKSAGKKRHCSQFLQAVEWSKHDIPVSQKKNISLFVVCVCVCMFGPSEKA
jgi:hypothetical protein